jgi:hypothetical protein
VHVEPRSGALELSRPPRRLTRQRFDRQGFIAHLRVAPVFFAIDPASGRYRFRSAETETLILLGSNIQVERHVAALSRPKAAPIIELPHCSAGARCFDEEPHTSRVGRSPQHERKIHPAVVCAAATNEDSGKSTRTEFIGSPKRIFKSPAQGFGPYGRLSSGK